MFSNSQPFSPNNPSSFGLNAMRSSPAQPTFGYISPDQQSQPGYNNRPSGVSPSSGLNAYDGVWGSSGFGSSMGVPGYGYNPNQVHKDVNGKMGYNIAPSTGVPVDYRYNQTPLSPYNAFPSQQLHQHPHQRISQSTSTSGYVDYQTQPQVRAAQTYGSHQYSAVPDARGVTQQQQMMRQQQLQQLQLQQQQQQQFQQQQQQQGRFRAASGDYAGYDNGVAGGYYGGVGMNQQGHGYTPGQSLGAIGQQVKGVAGQQQSGGQGRNMW
jgi:hypothetical protein